MAKDYERINFNIKLDLIEEVDRYCSGAGFGRSALLNYLVAQALHDKSTQKLLADLIAKRKEI